MAVSAHKASPDRVVEQALPSCTMWVDGFNGVANHPRQTMNFAIIVALEFGG